MNLVDRRSVMVDMGFTSLEQPSLAGGGDSTFYLPDNIVTTLLSC